jgi:DNA gyrase subunit B
LHYQSKPTKLEDCQLHGPQSGSELFVVEGDSASTAVAIVRNLANQAVLPMQGKPLNAWRASKNKVSKNEFFNAFIEALGAGWDETFDVQSMRYQKVILLFDPDADGIHCEMLFLLFIYRWMRPLLDAGRLAAIRSPICEITAEGMAKGICARTDEEANGHIAKLQSNGPVVTKKKAFRGLASMNHAILSEYCVRPETRSIHPQSHHDAEAVLSILESRR